MIWDPQYENDQGWLVHAYRLTTGNVLRFAAKDIRRERTGIHAKVLISLNWITLAYSVFNIDRDEDRVRLANSAYKHLKEDKPLDRAEMPENIFKHAFDLFCLGLWEKYVGGQVGGMMAGDPNRSTAKRLIGDYVLEEAGTIGFGPPGGGKSYTALAMAVSCAWGLDTIWRVHRASLPLYLNVERSAGSMSARLARVNLALGRQAEDPLPFLNARGRSLADIYDAARQTLAVEGCEWVIYDSISRAGFGSLTQDDTANRIMDLLNALSPTWLALAHSPRQDESHAFGSQMFDAAADLALQIRSQSRADGSATGVGLQGIKANDIPLPRLRIHVFEWDSNGLTGIRLATEGEFAELTAGERRSREDMARDYLLEVGTATAMDVADHFKWARTHTHTMLNAMAGLIKVRRGRQMFFSVESQRTVPF